MGGDGWAPGGCYTIPLCDWNKVPSYENWQRGETAAWSSVKVWMEKRREQTGRLPSVTGRFVVMNGWGVVIDLEGRKWRDSAVGRVAVPSWIEAILECARGGALASWVSASGDGGKDVRNVLIPYPVKDVCAALGIAEVSGAAASLGAAAAGSSGFRRESYVLGEEMKAELLVRSGVCVPESEVIAESGELAGVKSSVAWRGVLGPGSSVLALQEQARPVMRDLVDVLRGALVAAAETGGSEKAGGFLAGAGSDGAPLVKELEVVLWRDGPDAGLRVTGEMLEAGASRHYLAKTWANWAILSRGRGLLERVGDRGVIGAIDVIAAKIGDDWADAAGFSAREIRKSVLEEARFLNWV